MSTPATKSSSHKKAAIVVGTILFLGGFILVTKTLRSAKSKRLLDNLPDSNVRSVASKPIQAPATSVFPLKNGSPKSNLVAQLQTLLGVDADGLFGPKTQAALLSKTGKMMITSQTDYNNVITKLQNSAALVANSSRAEDLVSKWKANPALQLATNAKALFIGVVEDAYGALTTTGNNVTLGANYNLNRNDYTPIGATTLGFLKVTINNGAFKGSYKVDPTKITVS